MIICAQVALGASATFLPTTAPVFTPNPYHLPLIWQSPKATCACNLNVCPGCLISFTHIYNSYQLLSPRPTHPRIQSCLHVPEMWQ